MKYKMRYVSVLLVIIGINWFNISHSQKVENVLIVNFQDKEFFAPDIINCLNSLKVEKKDTITKAFDKILVINQLQYHVTEQAGIKNLTDYFKQDSKYKDLSEGAKKIYDTISKSLGDYNSYLDINTNQINELIEIQFSLYTNILKRGDQTFATKDPRNPDKFQSAFFIPIEDNYVYIIEKNLKKLFPETNIPPISIIALNGKYNIKNKQKVCSTGDTITLDGSYSSDRDSRKEDLVYSWRVINTKESPIVTSIKDYNKPTIRFTLEKPGKYFFGLKINDGIAYSTEDTICLTIILKPQIYIQNTKYEYVYQQHLIGKKSKFKFCVKVASGLWNRVNSYLTVKDINRDAYLFKENVNLFDMSEIYSSSNTRVPSMDTINDYLPPLIYDSDNPNMTIDSVTTTPGEGYNVYCTGTPISSIYKFKIQEEYQGVTSNAYNIEFQSNILSGQKLFYKFQRARLKPKVPSNADTISNSNFYYSSSNALFISGYLTKGLVFDFNLGRLFHDPFKTYFTRYESILSISYEIPSPNARFAPYISLGAYGRDKDHQDTMLGYGFDIMYNFKYLVYLYFGPQYLYGYHYTGLSYNIGLKIDVDKIFSVLNYPNLHIFK